ncbi:hypothetical protein Tco_0834653 [Tanacetum coccineum]
MTSTAAQQVALDNPLVAPENRVQIGKCNIRIDPIKTPKEITYQVVLDSLALSFLYPTFLITAEVPKIYMHQFWHTITKIKNSSSYKFKLDKKKCTINVEVFRDILQICPRLPNKEFDAPPSDEEIVTFIKELGHRGNIKSATKVVVDQMHQPWRTFATIINRCLSGKTSDFTFRIENRDCKKQEKVYYPRFTKAVIHYFISKDKSISMRNKIFMDTIRDDSILGPMRFFSKLDKYQVCGALLLEGATNQQMRDSLAYKTYLAFAIGVASPKKARKFKKPASPSKKKALVAIEEPSGKPVKKPTAKRQSAGVKIRDTPGVSVSIEKGYKKSKRETNIHQAGGSSEGADLESKVLDEPKGKSIDTNKGTGLKPGVLDVSKEDSSGSEYKYWGDSDGGDDDDDQQSDDESTKFDDNKSVDLNKTNDEKEDKFVHTPDDYVPTDDENINDEEYKRINEEMYDDVNVELKDAEPANEEKVKDDAQETVMAALATQKTEVLLQSSFISSDYATKYLNFDNIPSSEMEIISVMDIKVQHEDPSIQTSPLLTVPVRVLNLEKDGKELKNVDNSSTLRATIKSKVSAAVKEYLGTSLDDTLYKVLQKHTANLSKEHSILADVVEKLKQQDKPQKNAEDIRKDKMEQAGKQLDS